MSHQVENMFYVDEKPWHGLGIELNEPPTIEEAIRLAGLNWEVGKKPLVTQDTQETVPAFATYRKSDNSILGVVGPNYHVLQNKDAFQFFQPLVESGDVTLETAGSLKEGRRVWILAKIKGDPMEIVKGDIVEKFVLLSNSHDGTLSVRVGFTPIRVVCNNTLTLAHNDKASSQLIRLRHSSQVKENLEMLRNAMNIANQQFETDAKYFYQLLAQKDINSQDLKNYVRLCLNISEKDAETKTKSKNRINEVIGLFEAGRGNDLKGVRGTYWAAYNSVTEYLSYNKGHNKDSRLDSLWFGDSARLNKKALDLGVEMATAA